MLTILALATSQPINNTKLQYVLDLHSSDITGLLSTLVKKNYLFPTGLVRGTTYTLNRAYVKALDDKNKDKFKEQDSDRISPENKDVNFSISANKDKVHDEVKDKVGSKDIDGQSFDNQDNNFSIPANKDKAHDEAKDKVLRDKSIIIEELKKYCSIWRKSSEMARYVVKTPHCISRSIIPSMLDTGILVREYPDNPTHPGQRYRTIPK